MTGFFSGSATAMITPFYADGVNFDAFAKMIDYQISGGTDALVILGTTGEPATMTEEEKEEVMLFSVRHVAGRAKVIFGVGSNCTAKAVAAAKKAEDMGADGVLAVTPYYNKCTQNGLIAYYEEICRAIDLPVIAYNVPSRTGVNILPETMEKLAALPNMAGIKEASGNMKQIMETARRIRGKCDLYSGDDNLNLPILAIGGTGVISVVSNLCPAKIKALTAAAIKGDLETARKLSDELLPLADACFTEVNPIPVKAGMALLGFEAGTPRSPLTELEEAHRELLKKEMKKVGLNV